MHKNKFLILFFFFGFFHFLHAQPNTHDHFLDEANLFSQDFKQKIENTLEQYQQTYDQGIYLFFFNSLKGESIESLAQRLLQKRSAQNHYPTAFFIVSMAERRIQIEVNPQGEKVWPSLKTKAAIEQAQEFFRKKNYEQGISQALHELTHGRLKSLEGQQPHRPLSKYAQSWFYQSRAILAALMFFFILFFGRERRKRLKKMEESLPFTQPSSSLEELKEKTQVEVIPFVLKQSSPYPGAHLRVALLGALVVTPLLSLIPLPWGEKNFTWFLGAQIFLFFIGYIFASKTPLKRLFLSSSEMSERVYSKGLQLFHHDQFAHPQEGRFLVLFVSLFEKQAELIPDHHLLKKLEPSQLKRVSKQITQSLKREGLEAALSAGIQALSPLLEESLSKESPPCEERPTNPSPASEWAQESSYPPNDQNEHR